MLSPNDLTALIIKNESSFPFSIIGGQADWGKPWDLWIEDRRSGKPHHHFAPEIHLLRVYLRCLSEFFQSGHGTCRVIYTLSDFGRRWRLVAVSCFDICLLSICLQDHVVLAMKASARQHRLELLRLNLDPSLCESFFGHAFAPKLALLGAYRRASGRRSDASFP